ncbi:hypothetical protein FQA39_LY18059 [Lamprigera yunnana]|nr:hypothetical protein FQA39_LY18059 [Lamprigera yunnana]
MADTVKKSRIVSETDENLEESLLEEFNLRLMKCLSRDDLQNEDSHIYENVEIIKNGTDSTIGISLKKVTNEFLEEERKCYYVNGNMSDELNDNCKIQMTQINLEKLEDNTQPSLNLSTCLINDDLKSVKDRMLLSTEDTSCLLFTQTVTSPMLTPSEENIDFLRGFRRESTQTLSENTISDDSTKASCNGIASGENIYANIDISREQIKDHGEKELDMETNKNATTDMNNEEVEQLETCKSQFNGKSEELKSINIIKQINQCEHNEVTSNIDVSTVTESHFVETTTEVRTTTDTNGLKKKKSKKSKNQHEKENISVNETNCNEDNLFYNVNVKNLCRSFGDLSKIDVRRKRKNGERMKSSFSKFDALQKKNILNSQILDHENADACKKCGRPVFQMERVTAERSVWHRNCFRCIECSKQLLVDNFESHEGALYCKPHFKALFQRKAVEEDISTKLQKYELIIRENQPVELPPDVARASDKPDLGLEELHSLNVKERFQVFENVKNINDTFEKNSVKMERSPSILSKLARFQAKGMDVGVSDDYLNGVPVESSSDDEIEVEEMDGEDADLIRAKSVQKEKPFHFLQMSDVKSRWEQGNQQKKDDLREERKQEIQTIRSRLFLGKQGKMKEAYQQAIVESESNTHLKKEVPVDVTDTRLIKDKFEKGDVVNNEIKKETEDMSIFESGISKKSRSIFLELDAGNVKAPKVSPTSPVKLSTSIRSAREAYIAKQASEDTIKSSDQLTEITVRTSDIQDRFKFFETYTEPQQKRKEFRMTPPREGQIKSQTPEREVYVDPNIVRSDEVIEDSIIAKSSHTATKMLNKFRQMEENLLKGQEQQGPKPLKRFTPPREPLRHESSSERDSESEEETEEDIDNGRVMEQDLIEAQKAARAQKLRAKFERWEQNEIKRENSVNIAEEIGDEQSQLETARSLCAKFESLRDTNTNQKQTNRVKVNRFV